MKKIIFLIVILMISINFSAFAAVYPDYSMKWNFELFNDHDARQVALNLAKSQEELLKEAIETDPIDQFIDGLERRLYTSAQRKIIDMIIDEDEVASGNFDIGDLSIVVAEDPETGQVLVEIVDKISGDSTIVTYSNDYFGDDFSDSGFYF
ncbi:MAG: curli assembly protein CsgF [Bacillota bacterium]